MGMLTKPALDDLLDGGCSCGGAKLQFYTYVDGRFAILDGGQYGDVVWVYKGETFVDGVFEVSCSTCKKVLFASEVCPRCHADDALATVLASPNRLAIPQSCPRCAANLLSYTAMLPARVTYEGKRAQKARARIDMVEDGFHGYRADCKGCGWAVQITGSCPLCTAAGPLRPRPD